MPRQATDPGEIREAVGGRVAGARKRSGLTQVQLAQAVGIDSQTISKIERGLQTPTGTTLRGLSAALGVSASYLLGEENEVPEDLDPLARERASDLTPDGRKVIKEYLGSTHGRSAPRRVKARLRAGAEFLYLGVTSPGWRDVDDLRNILERQTASPSEVVVTARDAARPAAAAYGERKQAAREEDAAQAPARGRTRKHGSSKNSRPKR